MSFIYRFHGINFTSEIDLEVNQSKHADSPLFHCLISRIDNPEPYRSPPVWESEFKLDDGQPQARIFRLEDELWMQLPRVGGVVFREHGVGVYQAGPVSLAAYFLGRALSLWLELKCILVLHGTCLESGGHGFALLGYTGAGKSTMGAYLATHGCGLVTEDVLPIVDCGDPLIHRGASQIRLWPDSGAFVFEAFSQFPPIHEYTEKRKINIDSTSGLASEREKVDLEAIFVLDRSEEAESIEMVDMAPSDALVELVRQSFGAGPTHALDLHRGRMKGLAQLVEKVPVIRLIYPSGFENLAGVRETIQEFLAAGNVRTAT